MLLQNKAEIERLLRQDNIYLHLYALGDLEDFHWPHSKYYTLPGDRVQPVLLHYSGLSIPTVLALTEKAPIPMKELARSVIPLLPKSFYAHLSEALIALFEENFGVESHGIFYKMGLTDPSKSAAVDTAHVEPLSAADIEELKRFYDHSYPGHWFEPQMIQSGGYYGIRKGGKLVSVAGIHVRSSFYSVAALGNIATHPDYRGQGLATAACARLCQELLPEIEHIGLNVQTSNQSAVACYQRLGFESVATYQECMIEVRG
jgi:ribosomal protein S18 acetylase RimI-like enzyme